MLKKLAWIYGAGFVAVFLITHMPGFTDSNGFLFGLFKIDPIDDVVHLLSGIAGIFVALFATRYISFYFKAIGILYGIDVVVGLMQQRGFLDFSIFTQGLGKPDFSLTNFAINLPHIVIAGIALAIGFGTSAVPDRKSV